jgi:hypothetical protein
LPENLKMASDFWEKSKKIEANTRMAKNKVAAKTIKKPSKNPF